MRHPPQLFGDDAIPWCVFREDRARSFLAVREVVLSGVPRAEAEKAAREINLRRRLVFGRTPYFAAPEAR